MGTKNLVTCSVCDERGTKSILGEITSEGYFSIMRFHRAYTNIFGKDFGVMCGNCGEPMYIKKEPEIKITTTKFVGTFS